MLPSNATGPIGMRDDALHPFGALILAAGGSTRMGQLKQMLPVQGQPLVLRAVQAALASRAWPVVVVLGNKADEIRPLLVRLPLQLAVNPRWSEGIGSSIARGIDILDQFSASLDGALIALADQPHFSSSAVGALAAGFAGPNAIAAARYSGTVGAPAIFGRAFFPQLLALAPDHGAQHLLRQHPDRVTLVDLPELAVDLDTLEDYQRFLERLPSS